MKVGEQQISILIASKIAEEQGVEKISWRNLAEVLNVEGPCKKSPRQWQAVY